MEEVVKEALERIHDEDRRQNHRLDELEQVIKSMQEITNSVQELAINMKHMAEEQIKQGEKLDQLEKSPVESFKAAKRTALSTIIGIIAGAATTGLIHLIVQNM